MLSGLTAYGYCAGSLTGVVDEDTRAALSQMQKDNNLKITGTVMASCFTGGTPPVVPPRHLAGRANDRAICSIAE
ncbi:peptidoglycan-binding domain-containing protein [Rhizobium ruizarguesonis]|uniref:peptidoglycan-binding domain-containing protein n=1 Tax=Rhizobium ruizarguesonis TaxID=2081791 RepID=UPI001FDFB5FF|nr:peptidoglycan-binding domain-containing protein [Rhizobium ruizarguesonis]